MGRQKNKRGQISIFIIAGIIIVAGIVFFFLLRGNVAPKIGGWQEINMNSFLDSCVGDKIKEAVEIIGLQGGHINNPLSKEFKFEGEEVFRKISYLCYNQNYYLPCVNQEPMLIQHLKKEIEDYISKDVENCFKDLTSSLEKQNYVVDAKYKGFEVELIPKKIIINLDGEIILTKAEETSRQEDFKIITPSRFYDLAIVVQEITSQEARFCNFEYLGYMMFYPQWKITKLSASDSTIIYTVEHKDSKEKFRFAVRSCAIPPGF